MTYCIYPQQPRPILETKLCQCIIEILPDRECIIVADDMIVCVASALSIIQRIKTEVNEREKRPPICRIFRRHQLQLEVSECLLYVQGGR